MFYYGTIVILIYEQWLLENTIYEFQNRDETPYCDEMDMKTSWVFQTDKFTAPRGLPGGLDFTGARTLYKPSPPFEGIDYLADR